jgi:cardiolipin synthase
VTPLFRLNIPNLITLARLLAVPFAVWLILHGQMLVAFWLFLGAGISDALDGFIAKHFDLRTVIGSYLDPLADKALLVSVLVTLGHAGYIDSWLVILIVFRDAVVVCGALLYQVLFQDLDVRPLMSGKISTALQFVFVATVLGLAGYGIDAETAIMAFSYLIAVATAYSGASYVVIWGRKVTALEPGE